MTKKDKELFELMKAFKNLSDKEQGFVFGLAQGFALCKPKSINEDDVYINNMILSYK